MTCHQRHACHPCRQPDQHQHHQHRRAAPTGSATLEYVIVAATIAALWLLHERSSAGLTQALKTWHAHFLWAMSIPW